MPALTTQAPRQGQGLSSRPPAEILEWSHYLDGEKKRKTWREDWPQTKHKIQTLIEKPGAAFTYTHTAQELFTSQSLSDGRIWHNLKTHTPCCFSLTYIPCSWWLLYLRGEPLNANMCFCPVVSGRAFSGLSFKHASLCGLLFWYTHKPPVGCEED